MDYRPTFIPYLDEIRTRAGDFALFDAHTHLGRNDPDEYRQAPEQLLARLQECDARALTFPMHEPDGYLDGVANDEVVAAALAAPDRLVALCRVDPNAGDAAVREARRALDAGARGIKLHPRGEQFTLGHPIVAALIAEADARGLPVMIHAGRGIPALGRDAATLARRHPDAKLILAHAGISDLAWLWRELPALPNLLIDTSWWNPADVVALYTLAPPGQVLFASDSPYGVPLVGAVQTLRCAVQAGLTAEQIRGTAGAQLARIVDGGPPPDLGPAPMRTEPLDPTLERVVSHLAATIGRAFAGADVVETLALARLACAVTADDPVAGLCAAVLDLLDRYETELAPPPPGQAFPESLRYLVAAIYVARTPAAGVPGSG